MIRPNSRSKQTAFAWTAMANYCGGVWTRDAFNGLRLWQRDLKPSPPKTAACCAWDRESPNVAKILASGEV